MVQALQRLCALRVPSDEFFLNCGRAPNIATGARPHCRSETIEVLDRRALGRTHPFTAAAAACAASVSSWALTCQRAARPRKACRATPTGSWWRLNVPAARCLRTSVRRSPPTCANDVARRMCRCTCHRHRTPACRANPGSVRISVCKGLRLFHGDGRLRRADRCGGKAESQPDQLGRGFVAGEMATRLDNLAHLRVDALDGVGRVDHSTHVRGNAKNGITRSQALRQTATAVGYVGPHSPSSNACRAASAASALGAV